MANAQYFPEHFRQTRGYAKQLRLDIQAARERKTLNPKTAFDIVARLLFDSYEKAGIGVSAPEFDTAKFTKEAQSALIYCEWQNHGGAVYGLDALLAEALGATGLSDVRLTDLKFSFDCFYLDFGGYSPLTLHTGEQVTGAYIHASPGTAVRICLTAPRVGQFTLIERSGEVYDLRVSAEHFELSLESAIEHALADDIKDLEMAAAQLLKKHEPGERGVQAAKSLIAAHKLNKGVFSKALSLVANTLCYLTAFPEDTKISWQRTSPDRLVALANSVLPKEAARAQSKLNAMGYQKVRYLGEEFARAARASEEGHPSPHWRRGHWRNQAHGPQLSQRKLIWLRPTRVLGAKMSDDARIYRVSKANNGS